MHPRTGVVGGADGADVDIVAGERGETDECGVVGGGGEEGACALDEAMVAVFNLEGGGTVGKPCDVQHVGAERVGAVDTDVGDRTVEVDATDMEFETIVLSRAIGVEVDGDGSVGGHEGSEVDERTGVAIVELCAGVAYTIVDAEVVAATLAFEGAFNLYQIAGGFRHEDDVRGLVGDV